MLPRRIFRPRAIRTIAGVKALPPVSALTQVEPVSVPITDECRLRAHAQRQEK